MGRGGIRLFMPEKGQGVVAIGDDV
jgi:hypothetical protein